VKVNRTALKIGIICVAMQDSGNAAATPALGEIANAMPDVAPVLIQNIATVAALFLALAPPIYARLLEVLSKKKILYIGAALFLIGGVGPFFFHENIWIILVFRALLGLGGGICTPLGTDLVVDFFEGKERNSMQGYVSAVISLSGILFTALGGVLAGFHWTYCFLAYSVGAIFLIIAFILVPEPDRKAKIASEEGSESVRAPIPPMTWAFFAILLLYFMGWATITTNGAMVVGGEGLADPASIGLLFSSMMVGNFIVSMLFGKIFSRLRFNLFPLAYGLGFIALLVLYFANTFTIFVIGAVMLGISLGANMPTMITKVTAMVPYSAAPRVIGWVFFAVGFGQFLQPLVFTLLGDYGFGRPAFLVGAFVLAALTVVITIVNKKTPILEERIEAKQ
jgi:MFS family permease